LNEVEIVVSSTDRSNAGVSSAERRFSALKGALGREGKAAGEAFSDNLSTGLKKLQIALDKSETSARELREEFAKTGNMELWPKIDKADRAVKQLSRRVEQFGQDAKKAGEEAGDGLAQGVEKRGGGRLKGLFAKIGPGLAAGAAAVGASAGALLMQGVQGAMERGSANAKLFASLNLEPGEAKKLGKLAGELYADAYGDSMGAVTDAIGAVRTSISGLATDASLKTATENALNFAAAFEIDVSRAALVAGVAVKSGLARDATEAFDLMTSAAQKVPKALVENVLDAAEEYAGFFHAVGMDGPQAFDALSRGAAKGQYGIDKVGDAIKEFTIRATDGSKLTTDAYKAMGLSSDKMSNDILAGGTKANKAFETIVGGLQKIKDPSERARTAIALFGTPLEDLSVGEIPEFLSGLQNLGNGMGDVEGRTKKLGDTLNDTAAVKLEGFKRKALGVLTEFGAKAIEVFESPTYREFGAEIGRIAADVGPEFREMFNTIGDAFKDNKPALMDLLRILGPVLSATFKTVGATIRGTMTAISLLVGSFKMVANVAITSALTMLRGLGWVGAAMGKLPGPAGAVGRSIAGAAAAGVRALQGLQRQINGMRGKTVWVSVGINAPAGAMAALRGLGPNRAHGGIVGAVPMAAAGGIRNGLTMVGEYGRELVELPPGSRVHPNGTTERMMAGGGGGPAQIIVSARPGASRDLMDALLQWLRFEVRTAGSGSAQTLLGTG